jgi:3-aminobutyryl-CoA ammonia-lyase
MSTHGPAAVGMTVTHRRYVPYSHAHYAGNLVDGAYSLAGFGDVATELCIRTDGDEGLFASYSDVQFRAPVRAGDCIEIEATLVRVGSRSREMSFEVRVIARGNHGSWRRRRASYLIVPCMPSTTRRNQEKTPYEQWNLGVPLTCGFVHHRR